MSQNRDHDLRSSDVDFAKKFDNGPRVNESIHITSPIKPNSKITYDKDQITKLGKIHENSIIKQLVTPDSRYLFTLDYDGNLKQFDVQEQYQERDYSELEVPGVKLMACLSDSRSLFISDTKNNVRQIDVRLAILDKEYGVIVDKGATITALMTTPVSKYLYVGDNTGRLQQFNTKQQFLEKDFGIVHGGAVLNLVSIYSGRYFYSIDEDTHLRQWYTRRGDCTKEFGKVHMRWIQAYEVTHNNKYLFTTAQAHVQDNSGSSQKQFNIETATYHRDFGTITYGNVYTMVSTSDSQHLFLGDSLGHIFEIGCDESHKSVKDFGKMHDTSILSIAVPANSFSIFTSDISGTLKQISIAKMEVQYNFKNLHKSGIITVMPSPDGVFLFTADEDGHLVQVCINKIFNDQKLNKLMAKKERDTIASQSKRSIAFNVHSNRAIDQRQNILLAQGQAQGNVVDSNADDLINTIDSKVNTLEKSLSKMQAKVENINNLSETSTVLSKKVTSLEEKFENVGKKIIGVESILDEILVTLS